MLWKSVLLIAALLLSSTLAFAEGGGNRELPASERGLLMISNLSSLRGGLKGFLYRMEERSAVRVADEHLSFHYGEMFVLEPKDATRENFLAALEALEANPRLRAVDVIVYLHGLPGHICFKGERGTKQNPTTCTNLEQLADSIRALRSDDGGSPRKLRMLYSDACFGASHMDAWLRAGFRVVNGATGIDSNKTFDMRRFLSRWAAEKTYERGIRKANRFLLTPLMDRAIDGNSFKQTRGDVSLTIDSDIL